MATTPSPGRTLGFVALISLSHVTVNALSIHRLRYMIYTAIVLNSIFVSALAIAVLGGARSHNSARFAFAKFFDGTAADDESVGWSVRASPAYVAVCGILFSQYTLLGFDASAHLCEETKQAVKVAPLALLSAVGSSFLFGFLLLLRLLFSIQDFDKVRTSPIPVLQIFTDSCGDRGGLVLMTIVMLCVWHCGLFSMVSSHTDSCPKRFTKPITILDEQLTYDVLFRSRWRHPSQIAHHRQALSLAHAHCYIRSGRRIPPLSPRPWLGYRLCRHHFYRHHRALHLIRHPYRHRPHLA